METVLGELIDWLQKRLKRRPVVMWSLVAIIFGVSCWLTWLEWAR